MRRVRLFGPIADGSMELIPFARWPKCTKCGSICDATCDATEIGREFCTNPQCAIFEATEKGHFHMECKCGWKWPMEAKEDPVKDLVRLFEERACPKCLWDELDVDLCNNDCGIAEGISFKDGEVHLHMKCGSCKFKWFSWTADVAEQPPVSEREIPAPEGSVKEAKIVPEE